MTILCFTFCIIKRQEFKLILGIMCICSNNEQGYDHVGKVGQ